MTTPAIIRAAVLFAGLAACSQPVFLAGLALDGASLVATGKSTGGHGLSALAGADCDPARAFAGEPLCRAPTPPARPAPGPAPSALAAIYVAAARPALVEPARYQAGADPAKLTEVR